MTDDTTIRDRASTALREAMKARDSEAVAALRGLLSEFANAEATPSQVQAGAIEAAPSLGAGAAEVDRLVLTETDLTAIAAREHDELGRIADAAEARGSADEVSRWRRRQDVVSRLLVDPNGAQ